MQNLFQTTKETRTTKNYTASGATWVETSQVDRKTESQLLGVTTVSVGLGVNPLDNLTIDFVAKQNMGFTGTYILSGVADKLVTQLTATYKF